MKIKLDENLPERLVSALTGLGHDVDTVYVERLNGRIDADVWNVTQAAHRFFITQDLDFSDMRRYTAGTHAGLLLVRLTRPARNELLERVSQVFTTENVEGLDEPHNRNDDVNSADRAPRCKNGKGPARAPSPNR